MYTTQVPVDSTAVMGRRFGAFIIDTILGLIVAAIALFALSTSVENARFTCDDVREEYNLNICFSVGDDIRYAEGSDVLAIYGIGVLFSFLNAAVLQASGGSIGKRMVGLAVVRQSTGQTLGFGKSIVRWLVSIVDIGCCFLIGLIMALATKGHRRLGDMAAGSVVVAKSSVGTVPTFPGSGMAPPPTGGWSPPPGAGFGPPPGPGGYGAPPAPGMPGAPGQWAPPAPPADPWRQPAAPPADPWRQPIAPAAPAPEPPPVIEPAVEAAPAAPATDGPQWDVARNAYIQYEPVSGQWMQFDDAAQEWRPLS